MYVYVLNLHLFAISFFVIYIIFDRIYIRNFVYKSYREVFYTKVSIPIIINSLNIIISGVYLLFDIEITLLVYTKIIVVVFLFYGFFNCPFYMKKQTCKIRKFMYRFGVLILMIVSILLGLYI